MRDPDALRDTARVLLWLAAWAAAAGDGCSSGALVDRAAELLAEAGNVMLYQLVATV
jgi:hypothetical protein